MLESAYRFESTPITRFPTPQGGTNTILTDLAGRVIDCYTGMPIGVIYLDAEGCLRAENLHKKLLDGGKKTQSVADWGERADLAAAAIWHNYREGLSFCDRVKRFSWRWKQIMWLILGALGALVIATPIEEYMRDVYRKRDVFWAVEKELGRTKEEVAELPLSWQQVISHVALSPETYSPRLLGLLSEISSEEIWRFEQVARYTLTYAPAYQAEEDAGSFVLRAPEFPSSHAVDRVTQLDLVKLEEIGLLNHTERGVEIHISSMEPGRYRQFLYNGDLGLLVGHEDSARRVTFSVARLTDLGNELLRLRHSGSDPALFPTAARKLFKDGFTACIWTARSGADGLPVAWQFQATIDGRECPDHERLE